MTIDYAKLKAGGFIKQIQPDLFAIRLQVPVGDLSAAQLKVISEAAKKYGSGKVHLTTRQGIEVNDVKFEDFEKVTEYLAKANLSLGACGPRVRVVTGCPGSKVCPKGLGDTKVLGKKLNAKFFGGDVPHKFKMAVTGCPNSCAKPQENDWGFVAVVEPRLNEKEAECIKCGLCKKQCPSGSITLVKGKPVFNYAKCINDGACIQVCPTRVIVSKRSGWNAFIGGRFGKKPALGRLFKTFLTDKEALALTNKVIFAFKQLAKAGERLGVLIERIGVANFEKEVLKQ